MPSWANLDALNRMPGRSAFTTALWLCGLIGIPSIGAAIIAPTWVAVWLLIVMTILVLGTFGVFAFHSVKNQDLLQSEDYLLRKDAIKVYGSSSYAGKEIVQLINLPPEKKMLTNKKGSKDDSSEQ